MLNSDKPSYVTADKPFTPTIENSNTTETSANPAKEILSYTHKIQEMFKTFKGIKEIL